jgi:hypothetical protein
MDDSVPVRGAMPYSTAQHSVARKKTEQGGVEQRRAAQSREGRVDQTGTPQNLL